MNNGQRLRQDGVAPSRRVLEQSRIRPPVQVPVTASGFDRTISLSFANVKGFLTEYSANISVAGMFVRSPRPSLPGTVLDLELCLFDGLKLIRGSATVVWAREADLGPEQPAGMGVRFLKLDPASRRLVHWVVEKHLGGGAPPFDLDAPPTS